MSDLADFANLNTSFLKSLYGGTPTGAVATHTNAPSMSGSILDSILEVVDAINGTYRPRRKELTQDILLADAMAHFCGYQVIKAQVFAKMRLAEDVTVSPEFRDEMNAWMLQFFGATCVVERGNCLFMEDQKTIVVHPDDYEVLRIGTRVGQPLFMF